MSEFRRRLMGNGGGARWVFKGTATKPGTIFIASQSKYIKITPDANGHFEEILDLEGVTNLGEMIKNGTLNNSLKTLDLSVFDTSEVTNMNAMFQNCAHLIELDVSGFDISNVTTMESMFFGMGNGFIGTPEPLDLSGFAVKPNIKMNQMFYSANIAYLDLSGWEFGTENTYSSIFNRYNTKLSKVKVEGCSEVTISNLITALQTGIGGSWNVLDNNYIIKG